VNAPPARPLVTFERVGAIQAKPIDWLVTGLLARDTLAALVGPSGCGKTFAYCSLAYHVALGLPWFGREVAVGAVFILAGEGRTGLRKRFAGLEKHHGTPLASAPLFIADGLPTLCTDANAASVIQAIQTAADDAFFANGGAEPALVIIDTVARAMGGANENAAADMGALVAAMDWIRNTWGATVLAIHHTGHENGDRARGSSAFFAAMDTELLLRAGDDILTLKTSKAKDWPSAQPIGLRRQVIEVGVPSVDVEGVPVTVPETTLVLVDDAGAEVGRSKADTVEWYAANGYSQRATARETRIRLATVNALWPKPHEPP
jgi:hypothetical protein